MRFSVLVEPTLYDWQVATIDRLVGAGAQLAQFLVLDAAPLENRRVADLYRAARDVIADAESRFIATRVRADMLAAAGLERVDALLNLTRFPIRGCASASEVWSFDHIGIPGFWPIYDGAQTTSVRLVAHAVDGSRTALASGVFPLFGYSFAATARDVLMECASWPQRAFLGRTKRSPMSEGPLAVRIPHAHAIRKVRRRLAQHAVEQRIQSYFRHEDWNVGVASTSAADLLANHSIGEVRWVPPRAAGKFLADPFAYADGDTLRILCEDYDYKSDKGVIASVCVGQKGKIDKPELAIETPYHMSYPYCLEYRGSLYCIPETHQAREVRLYRHADGGAWEHVATLLRGIAALDSTVVFAHGRFWLWCADADAGSNHKLFLYMAEDLLGAWVPHPMNPLKIDVRSARPGGTPFEESGILYRPAQDCSRTYGGRIAINRIDVLTCEHYAEETVGFIDPPLAGPYRAGLHTLSFIDGHCVIDAKRFRFAPSGFLRAIKQKLSGPKTA